MKCLKCNSADFEKRNVRFCPKVKDQLVEVIITCPVCRSCNTPILGAEEMNLLRREASDVYREKNGLLTSKQIISYRTKFKMTQQAFANYLNVGEASIKRWESSCIQDFSQDDHIRLKCDEEEAKKNYLFILSNTPDVDIYTGNKPLSPHLSSNVQAYLQMEFPELTTYNVLQFYIDFFHFKHFDHSITGQKYVLLKHGPCPYSLDLFCRKTIKKPEPFLQDCFDDHETSTIHKVCAAYKKMGGKHFCAMALSERGYLETNESEYISYNYAKDLLI